ncbi:MAG: hemolysin hemolytic protein [Bacteroidales bacterium]|nr:hemolysin hemolytic protein [Bacteroidales bacterium]
MYDIPILFVFFNRPEIALRAFQSIRACRPKRLYLACDGPREHVPGEGKVVEELRASVCASVDWDCSVQTFFQEKNVGCGPNVHAAISWLFANEEWGIVLEDDCIADPSFFPYVQDLLETYRDDQRVGMIAGTNPVASAYKAPYSYLFSRFKNCWGWASWRRAWEAMDFSMQWRNTPLAASVIDNSGYRGKDNHRWKWQLQYIDNAWVSSWDWQWYFTLSARNQLCVFPGVNLISNIGNDAAATHNASGNITFRTYAMAFPLRRPPVMAPDIAFEKQMYRHTSSLSLRVNRHIPHCLKALKRRLLSWWK